MDSLSIFRFVLPQRINIRLPLLVHSVHMLIGKCHGVEASYVADHKKIEGKLDDLAAMVRTLTDLQKSLSLLLYVEFVLLLIILQRLVLC